MSTTVVLLAVLAATLGNATVFATVGLLGRSIGLSELEVGTIFASSALLFFLTSAGWGRLADRSGRRPVIVAGLAGTAASLFLFAGFGTLGQQDIGTAAAFAALLAVRILYGMLAGGTQPAAMAYMADVTTDDERHVGAASVGAAVGPGSIAGPLLAALLVGFGFAVPLLAAGAFVALAAVATHLAMHEAGHPLTATVARAAQPLGPLAPYLLFAFAMYFGFATLQTTTAFYVQDLLAIDTTRAVQRAGLVSAAFAACAFVVQAFAVRRLSVAPHRLLAVGTAICLLGLVSCVAAPRFHWLLAAFGAAGVGYGLAQPGLTASTLLAADSDKQGEVAGYLQAAGSAAWIGGALAGTAVYATHFKGPLLLANGAIALGALALLVLRRQSHRRPSQRQCQRQW